MIRVLKGRDRDRKTILPLLNFFPDLLLQCAIAPSFNNITYTKSKRFSLIVMVNITIQRLTFEEYLAHDDGTDNHYELVDGLMVLMNPPRIEHFLIAKFLEQQLDTEIQRLSLPWLTFRETGVRTGYNKSRLMDLCVVTHEQAKELLGQSAVFQTPPRLIVEVVSPDSIARDYRYKRSEYAALSVPEYWIVDPLTAKVTLLLWEEGLYEETGFVGTQTIASPTLPDLSLTVEQILTAGTLG